MKVRELRGLIFSRFDSESQCALALGWKRQHLNKITNGNKVPDVNEINDLASVLGVQVNDIADIFLRLQSPNEQQKESRPA